MLTMQEIAEAVEGHLIWVPGADAEFTSVVVDSRQVIPGSLFVALKGTTQDGHDFVADAIARGAGAALVEKPPVEWPLAAVATFPLIQVKDSLLALQAMARQWRRKVGLTVVAVTGSVGKTTTKEVLSSLLDNRFSVLKGEGNLNTEIGLPLNLLRITPRHQVAVVEMGMYALGEIRALARIAEPNVGVVTNVGPTHLERLGTIDRIAEAKGELVEELPASGLAVLNLDDPRVRAMEKKSRAAVAFYGLDPEAGFWADSVQGRGLQGIEFDLHHGGDWLHVRMPLLGLHSVHAALAASVVAHHLGMPLEEIAGGLHEVSTSLRLIAEAGINGSTVVDDCYNASPASTLAALTLLNELSGRRVAVLGDMLELGSFAAEGHQMVGRRAADVADVLITVGELGALVGQEALADGKDAEAVFLARDNDDAIKKLRTILRPGDCVLVKGSRGMQMEQIVEAIRCPTP